MPRGNNWYSNLEANDPAKKKELSKYIKMYRRIKADIRQLTLDLARNTALPDDSKVCYRALHRVFNEKSITRSKEAARLMLVIGDPDLLRALHRRYQKKNCPGYIKVQPRVEESDVKKVHGRPVGRIAISGDVIHTVFAETEGNQGGSSQAPQNKSIMKRKSLINKEPNQTITDNESNGNARQQSFLSRPSFDKNILPQENSFLVNQDKRGTFPTSSNVDHPPLKKNCIGLVNEIMLDQNQNVYSRKDRLDLSAQYNVQTQRDFVVNVVEKAGIVDFPSHHGHLSSLRATPVPKDSIVDRTALTSNNNQYPRPSSGPAILVSDNSPDQNKRMLHLTSLHHRPGAIHLPDGRISIPASLSKIRSTTFINGVKSSQEVSQMSIKYFSQTRKNVGMASMNPLNEYELAQDIFDDLHVVKQHRRSFFADGNSLVEVRPRSMPTAPTLIATHTPQGQFNVPIDIDSNRRAILVINAMNNTLCTH